MERIISHKQQQVAPTVRSILLGGTGATTPQEGIEAIGGIHQSKVGEAMGIVPLDNKSIILLEYIPPLIGTAHPALDGSVEVYTTDLSQFYNITNFDSNTPYVVTTNKGSVSVNGDTVMFVPPTTPGIAVITVNGKNFPITVLSPYADKPIITIPQNNQQNVSRHAMFFDTIVVYGVNSPTFSSITWQIATDTLFTNIIFEGNTLTQVLALSTLTTPLDLNTTYYARVRHYVDALSVSTDWSDTVSFVTTNNAYPTTETTIYHRPDLASEALGGNFGVSVSLSPDGTIMVITDRSAYFYKKINGTWVYQHVLPYPNGLAMFGDTVLILPDKQTFIINDTYASDSNSFGAVYIYKTSVLDDYSTLTLIQTITEPDALTFGYGMSMSAIGNKIAISRKATTYGVSIYEHNGTEYARTYVIDNPDLANNFSNFAISWQTGKNSFDLNSNGDRLVVGDLQGGVNYAGIVYIFDFNGTEWILSSTLEPDQNIVDENFGWPIKISNNGDTIVCGNYISGFPTQGGLYFFKLDNAIWTKTQHIVEPDWNGNTLGGQAAAFVFSNQNNTLVIASPWQTALSSELPDWGSSNADGAVYVYNKDNNGVWVNMYKYVASDYYRNNYFGQGLAVNADCTEVIIAAPYTYWSNGGSNDNGTVYIFE